MMRQKVWVTIASLTAVLAVGVLAFVWLYHQAVPGDLGYGQKPAITGRLIERVSEASAAELIALIKKEEMLSGASVVRVDLVKNRRSTIYLKTDDQRLQDAWDEYLQNRVAPPPVFSAQEPVQNNQVANLFNGNFVCLKFEDTVNYTYWPKGAEFAPWVCSSPIPPGFDGSGDFTGFINLFLKTEPTEIEKQRLAKAVAEISKNIYKRDVENAAPSK